MTMRWALLAGVMLGVAYTLSPLTVLCLALLIAVTRWAGRDLTGRERERFVALVTLAIVLRLALIAGLFLFADPSKPYATFFGDEEIFKSRPIWLRNIGLGVPISAADFIYALDETGMSGHLYVLAYLQALVGDAPYGAHVFNAAVYVTSVLLLYRLVRPSFGRPAAMGGLVVLLFLPSLFSWSVSVLKEPFYALLAVFELICVLALARAPQWRHKVLAIAGIVLLAVALESIRKGSLLIVSIGTVAGLAAAITVRRPRLLLAAAVVIPLVAMMAMTRPFVQSRIRSVAIAGARYHAGHVVTPGISYRILDPRYYTDWNSMPGMSNREVALFITRALTSYFIEPLPSSVQSRALWAYLPEQLVWLLLLALVPFGIRHGLKRDPTLTCILLAHACGVILVVALNSGNVGTLIRHRGLSLPYTVWLSGLGGAAVVARVHQRSSAVIEGTRTHGDR
ncbi:MAG: glycosyltransferase family 39 protein [Acidobacteriota bacterium]|nr:glycosyltransferase family 39 protein [Acidobacteriota bacterium]